MTLDRWTSLPLTLATTGSLSEPASWAAAARGDDTKASASAAARKIENAMS